MFSGGYEGLVGLLDAETVSKISRLSLAIENALRHPRGRVVFAGCGTSGRLSHFHAHSLNASWLAAGGSTPTPFSYILAGGDAALVLPQEAAEDSPSSALASMDAWERSSRLMGSRGASENDGSPGSADAPTVFLGITCGLSAPFVSTLVSVALDRLDAGERNWTVAVLGFNPLEALEAVPGLASVYSTFKRLSERDDGVGSSCVLINPCLGPESVAGSSRLKGGSATSIVIQSASLAALTSVLCVNPEKGCLSPSVNSEGVESRREALLLDTLLQFSSTLSRTYHAVLRVPKSEGIPGAPTPILAEMCETAGRSMCTPSLTSPTGKGRLIYIGVGPAGVLALTDASECPPTFGSLFDDVRGFLPGGWASILEPLSAASLPRLIIPTQLSGGGRGNSEAAIDLEEAFLSATLPTLSAADTVIFVGIEGCGSIEEWCRATTACLESRKRGASVFHLAVVTSDSPNKRDITQLVASVPRGVCLTLPYLGLSWQPASTFSTAPALGLLSLKLCLNAVSTLAHIQRGCIVSGRMIAMCITNCKLFSRGVGIIKEVAHVEERRARTCLVMAIHGANYTEKTGGQEEVEGHVAAASNRRDVLPVAILLAIGAESIHEAREMLKREPIVSRAIAEAAARGDLSSPSLVGVTSDN